MELTTMHIVRENIGVERHNEKHVTYNFDTLHLPYNTKDLHSLEDAGYVWG
eukprot:c56942_g1_i1 orf=135-287(+)